MIRNNALILTYLGEKACDIYNNLISWAEDETHEDVITLSDGHFSPKSSERY